MRTGRLASLVALTAGLALVGWSALQGEISVHLVLVIPVVTGTGPWAALGMLLAMAGLVGWVLTGVGWPPGRPRDGAAQAPGPDAGTRGPRASTEPAAARDEAASGRAKGGGVLLIGPIPIAWGSDRSSLVAVIVATIVLMVVALGVTYHLGT